MTLADDIQNYARTTFETAWKTRDGQSVPAPEDLRLGNEAVHFERATVLYADLDQSTSLVEDYTWTFAAEIYKTYLYAATKLIKDAGGTIVSYDGDRVMGLFTSKSQCNDAARCALKINFAVKHYVQDALAAQYDQRSYKIKHVVGIDTSEIRTTRTGVRGDNDLVWVGGAANLAAKLTAESAEHATWITDRVHACLHDPQRYASGVDMWRSWTWSKHSDDRVYSSNYWWSF